MSRRRERRAAREGAGDGRTEEREEEERERLDWDFLSAALKICRRISGGICKVQNQTSAQGILIERRGEDVLEGWEGAEKGRGKEGRKGSRW